MADSDAIGHRLAQLADAGPVAPVAPDTPLLANLSARENLVLVAAFQGRSGAEELEERAADRLRRLDLGHCADRRRPELTAREAFLVQIARATMRPGATPVIVTPFFLVPELESDEPIHQALQALGVEEARILDYATNRDRYRHRDEVRP